MNLMPSLNLNNVYRRICYGTSIFLYAIISPSLAWGFGEDVPTYAIEGADAAAKNKGVQPLSDNLLGDSIDPHTGSITFTATDISLPGNSALPVELTRRRAEGYGYEFGYWRLQIPSLETNVFLGTYTNTNRNTSVVTGWHNNRCTGPYFPPTFSVYHRRDEKWRTVWAQGDDYSGGIKLNAPGAWGSQLITPSGIINWGSSAPRYVTNTNWKFTCTSSLKRGSGEGFVGVAPNGDKYHFDTLVYRKFNDPDYPRDQYGEIGPLLTPAGGAEYRALLYASKVEDVHGNWVKYDFAADGKLSRIHANDGREITFEYPGEHDFKAHANGRTWQYQFSSDPNAKHNHYSIPAVEDFIVTVPDGTQWKYTQRAPRFAWFKPGTDPDDYEITECDALDLVREEGFTDQYYLSDEYITRHLVHSDSSWNIPTSDYTAGEQGVIIVKHPSGTIGYFQARERKYRLRAGVLDPQLPIYFPSGFSSLSDECIQHVNHHSPSSTLNSDEKFDDTVSTLFSLVRPIAKKTLVGPGLPLRTTTYIYHDSDQENDLALRTIVSPDGTRRNLYFYQFPTNNHHLYGKLQRSETYSAQGQLLETKVHSYDKGAFMGHPFKRSFVANDNLDKTRYVPKPAETTITRGADTYTTRYTYNNDQSSANFSYRQPTKLESWSNTSGGYNQRRITDIEYYHNFSRWILGLTKRTVKNGKEFSLVDFNTYGKPNWENSFGVRKATYTYHSSGTANGQVKTVTDALNRTTTVNGYHRGQWTSVTRPDGTSLSKGVDNNGWTTSTTDAKGTQIFYSYDNMGRLKLVNKPAPWADITFSYDNLSSGMTSTRTEGTTRTVTEHNGFLQPLKTQQVALSGGGQTIYTNTQYDNMGRTAFVSQPSFSPTETKGVATEYDGLGRVTGLRETMAPYAYTRTQYLDGNATEVTDALGFVSTTYKSGYGSPDDGQVTLIENAISKTRIDYNIWGKQTQVTQFDAPTNGQQVSQTQRYYYNSRLELCRHSVPETGDTVYAYNNAGEMTYSSAGNATGSSCSLPSSNRVAYSYTNRGELKLVNYPDSTPDIHTDYDLNGNVKQVRNGTATWDYDYNNQDMLTSETLTVDGRVSSFIYDHNPYGAVKKITYPGGLQVPYGLDGFNRPVSVGGYITQATYQANGALDTLTFGNGVTQSFGISDRQLPSSVHIRNSGGTSLRYLGLEYDINLNLKSKIDYLQPGYTSHFDYDALNRLTDASGVWGSGEIDYDALGNITDKRMGTQNLDYHYDSRNRLASVSGSVPYSFGYDARGNVTGNSKHSFIYNLANQMTSTNNGAMQYGYDGNGKRVKKVKSGKTEYYAYSQSGSLLFKQGDGLDTAYIHINGKLIAKDKR